MNKKLQQLLTENNTEFSWNEADKVWCLSGVSDGNVWESDDLEADSKEQAMRHAIILLEDGEL